jgi:hypothetical protein
VIGLRDIHRSIVAVWDFYEVGDFFMDRWAPGDRDEYLTLTDTEADANQPWPYCVFDCASFPVVSRSSGKAAYQIREYGEIPLAFNIHAKDTDTETGKAIASDLAEEIMRKYGGHPEERPAKLKLTHGGVTNLQFQNSKGIRTGDTEYQWVVEYTIRTDIPAMVP